MIEEIYPYLLVALIGAFAHILRELARLEKITKVFSVKVWLKKNKYSTAYGLVLTVLVIILLWSTKELNWASAGLAGYAGDNLLKTKFSGFIGSPEPENDVGQSEEILPDPVTEEKED